MKIKPFIIRKNNILFVAFLAAFLVPGEVAAFEKTDSTLLLSIVSYGATPNDSSDDQLAIEKCIAAAKIQGKTVFIPEGTFRHSKLIKLNGVSMTGVDRETAILMATGLASTIYLSGNGGKLSNFTHAVASPIERDSETDHGNIGVWLATNFTIDNLYLHNSSNTGIFCRGASYGTIKNCYVNSTNADAIHNTFGSHHLTITSNKVRNNGDDMIAVVSYGSEDYCHDITITNNDCRGNYWGRGITVVGGYSVTITENTISDAAGAGILIATEGSSEWTTRNIFNVTIDSNTVTHCGLVTKHPGILLSGLNKNPKNRNIDNISITNTSSLNNPNGNYLEEGDVTNVKLEGNSGF